MPFLLFLLFKQLLPHQFKFKFHLFVDLVLVEVFSKVIEVALEALYVVFYIGSSFLVD